MNALLTKYLLFQTIFPHLAVVMLWLVKSTGMVLLGWSAAMFLRRHSAAARCWAWRAVLIGLIALAVFEFGPAAVKKFRWPARVAFHAEGVKEFWKESETLRLVIPENERQGLFDKKRDARRNAVESPPWEKNGVGAITVADMRSEAGQKIEGATFQALGLVAGVLVTMAILRTVAGLAWLRRKSVVADERVQEIGARVRAGMKIRARGEVRISPLVQSPLLTGWWRPLIYLPEAASEWPEEQLTSTFLHEFAHWRRRDPHWRLLGRILALALWWNPLVAWAVWCMNAESEEAADDAVILAGSGAGEYARLLIAVASQAPGGVIGSTGISMAGHRSLERRIRALLAVNPWRGKIGGWAMTLIGGLLVILTTGASLFVAQKSVAATRSAETSRPEVKLTSEQRSTLERILARNIRRMTALRFLHFKQESWLTEEGDGGIVKSPRPQKMEVWVDEWSGRQRIEYRPAVNRWINGAAPFSVRNRTEINDGQHSFSFEDERDLEMKGSSDLLGPVHHLQAEDNGNLIQKIQVMLAASSLQDANSVTTISAIDWNGQPAIQIREQFFRDGTVHQQRIFVVDVSSEDMLCFSELAFPKERPGQPSQHTVLEIGTASNGERYPRRYVKRYHHDARTEVEYTVTQFDVLPSLPEEITAAPKPASARFVAANGQPVRHANLTLQCLSTKDRQPMAGVAVTGRINRQEIKETKTDARGQVTFPLPAEELTDVSFKAVAPGCAVQTVFWRKRGNPLQLPETYPLHLQPGLPVSGRVVDESGQPVAGAKLEFSLWGSGSLAFSDHAWVGGVNAVSDANGQWSLPNFPADLTGLSTRISCPGYRASTDYGKAEFTGSTGQPVESLLDGTCVITLQRGAELKGQIVSSDGRGVGACRLTIGKDIHGTNCPTATTNASGEFVFKGLSVGPQWLTAEAPGFKPSAMEVKLPSSTPLAIKLENGRTVRGRVVMPDGKPCAGLNVGVDGWRELRTLTFTTHTDAQGHFVWNGAPDEPVEFVFGGCQNREFLCGLPLQPSDVEQVITMKPALHVRGTVLDAKTGKTIPHFQLIPGRIFKEEEQVQWERESAMACAQGHFEWKDNYIGTPRAMLIEAEGYQPLRTKTFATTQAASDETYRLKPVK
jgi:beta-lactamase regulating signal transducer with metallopeptidase domain